MRLILQSDKIYKIRLFNALRSEEFIERKSLYFSKYDLALDFKINGKNTFFYGDGEIKIGRNSYIGDFSTLQSLKDCKIHIGSNCSISHNVRFYTSTYVSDQNFCLDDLRKIKYGNIKVGNGVWIGANVMINPNVIIGDNAVIGANTVVVKNIDANTIVSGIPARLVRTKSRKDNFVDL